MFIIINVPELYYTIGGTGMHLHHNASLQYWWNDLLACSLTTDENHEYQVYIDLGIWEQSEGRLLNVHKVDIEMGTACMGNDRLQIVESWSWIYPYLAPTSR